MSPKARFLPSTAVEKGAGREIQIPQQHGRSWRPALLLGWISTNKHPQQKGQICFSARFQSCAPEWERKQEGWGGVRVENGMEEGRRAMRNLGQIILETFNLYRETD